MLAVTSSVRLIQNLNRLPVHPHTPPPDLPTLCLDHLLNRPRFVLRLCKPTQIVRDQMPVLAAWTLNNNDTLGVGSFGELVGAAMAACFDGAREGDCESLFDLADGRAFACDWDGCGVVGAGGGGGGFWEEDVGV